eukprot:3423405-Pyramimonas_sp.AAC.1
MSGAAGRGWLPRRDLPARRRSRSAAPGSGARRGQPRWQVGPLRSAPRAAGAHVGQGPRAAARTAGGPGTGHPGRRIRRCRRQE